MTDTSTLTHGRFADPARALGTDPRTDPRISAALAPFGLDAAPPPAPFGPDAPLPQLLEFAAAAEAGFEALFGALLDGIEPVPGVHRETRTIAGPDGGEITLFVSRPEQADGPLPGVLHIHGGGMVLLRAAHPGYGRFRDSLAATGLVMVGVEFRNGGGVLGPHPFPAGLDDCTAALEWMHAHRDELGIGSITVAGESGGANLSLATTIRAAREGRGDRIDGVYAIVPYVSGQYGRPEDERARRFPSLVENDGYLLSCGVMAILAAVYDPDGAHTDDPLAWPLHAAPADLAGLPPHVISVNEVDPLRDEGIAYHRALVDAGVDARLRTVPGACHGADVLMPTAVPDLYSATVADLHDFAAR